MAACISTAATTHAMKSTVDLNDWRNSLHDIKPEEIFELIEKAIDIAASHYPKEFIQRRERMAKMLLNSQLKSCACPDEIITHTEERKNSEDVHNINGSDCPPLDEAENFLADVISFDPAKLFNEIDDLDDDIYRDIEANNEKSLNEDSQRPSSCSSMTENKLGCAEVDLKPQNETNRKPDASESCKVTGSNATMDQHQQKANLETSKGKITDGDQQPVKRIRIKVIYSKSSNGHQESRNPAAPVLKPSLASLDESSLQAKLENSKRKFIDQRQQQENKRRKVQFIEPLSVPPDPQQQQSKSHQFKPPRKLGMMIRRSRL